MQVVQKDHRAIEIGGDVGETVKGKMKSSGMAFRHLFNTIYSNKHLAIVREIWANASDAHVAGGNPERPFDVVLPTALEPEFRCRDYGIGMDHEMICTRYSTMFDSTKENTNDQVGMFGIGKFTPFAYTDTYTLTAWDNAEKRVYAVYLDENGQPSITLLNREACEEERGIEISFPVSVKDIEAFRNAALQVSRGFTVKPSVLKGDIRLPENPIVAQGTNWTLFASNWFGQRGAYIRQGTVVYPLDPAPLAHAGLTQLEQQIFSSPFYLDCNIGDVEVSMSRESLSYNEATIANIIKLIKNVVSEIEAQYAGEIATLTTLYEKNRYVHKITSNAAIPTIIRQTVKRMVTHNGAEVDGYLAFTHEQLKKAGGDFHQFGFSSARKGLRFQSYLEKSGRQWEPEKRHRFAQQGLLVMVENLEPGKRLTHPGPRLLEYAGQVNQVMYLCGRENVSNVLWLRVRGIDTPEFAEIMEGLGNIPWKLINTLPKPAAIAGRTPVDKHEYDTFGLKREAYKKPYLDKMTSWQCLRKKVHLNDPDGGIILYVHCERDAIMWLSKDGTTTRRIGDGHVQYMAKALATMGILGHRDRIFMVPKAKWKLTGGSNWINFFDLVFETILSSGVTSADRTFLENGNNVDGDLLSMARDLERITAKTTKPLLYKGYWQEVMAARKPPKPVIHQHAHLIIDLMGKMGQEDFLLTNSSTSSLTNHWEEYIKAYPMMKFVGRGNGRYHEIEDCVIISDYINQMDAQAGRPLIKEPEEPATDTVVALAA